MKDIKWKQNDFSTSKNVYCGRKQRSLFFGLFIAQIDYHALGCPELKNRLVDERWIYNPVTDPSTWDKGCKICASGLAIVIFNSQRGLLQFHLHIFSLPHLNIQIFGCFTKQHGIFQLEVSVAQQLGLNLQLNRPACDRSSWKPWELANSTAVYEHCNWLGWPKFLWM